MDASLEQARQHAFGQGGLAGAGMAAEHDQLGFRHARQCKSSQGKHGRLFIM
ncbi:MAG: hypothetical protein MO853_02370 [Candidatus Protistobacter heckmanni]|nr:hypothetical protein [Candidatus Protistobacter heckmanni]